MVVKTEICAFSEFKIYPGHGIRYIGRDGKPFLFLSKRTRTFGVKKLKAQRLRWTTAWRRLHKKIKLSGQSKQRRVKVEKKERAIEGVTLEAIRKLKTALPKDKEALCQEAILEIKERKKAQQQKKQGDKKTINKEKQTQQKAQDKAAQKTQKKTNKVKK